jgi:uncharacterized membrane protein
MVTKDHVRFWEIDFLRGCAIVLMIIFHIAYNLYFFHAASIDIHAGIWSFLRITTFTLFYILIGISLTLSYYRTAVNDIFKGLIYFKFLKRGLMIFGLGLLITLASWLYLEEGFIIFGTLHFIGLAIILAYPFLKWTYSNILVGIVLIIFGMYIRTITLDFPWLLWLGFRPHNFYTVDYYPLLPYMGIILIGISLGNILYKDHNRKFHLADLSGILPVKVMNLMGRHSLVFYLIHQPIILICLNQLGIIRLFP